MSISHEQAVANLAHYNAKKRREQRKVRREQNKKVDMQRRSQERFTLDHQMSIAIQVGPQICALLRKMPVRKFVEEQKAE